jgi:uncharacterized membrane protein YfcA
MEYALAALIGLGAGVSSGLFGVGGGIIFVPALVFVLGLGQSEAEATSLLAIVPVALVGAWRQQGYGNVRPRTALMIGLMALPGAVLGAYVANELSDAVLELLFAGLCLYVALRMAQRALRPDTAADPTQATGGGGPGSASGTGGGAD